MLYQADAHDRDFRDSEEELQVVGSGQQKHPLEDVAGMIYYPAWRVNPAPIPSKIPYEGKPTNKNFKNSIKNWMGPYWKFSKIWILKYGPFFFCMGNIPFWLVRSIGI